MQVALLAEHRGACDLASQNWAGALTSLETSIGNPHLSLRLRGRSLALMGKAYHELGETARAATKLREARQCQFQCAEMGDLMEFTLPWLAMLKDDSALAGGRLQEYATNNLQSGNRVGEARCLILLARKSPDTRLDPAIRQRLSTIVEAAPLLGNGRLMRQITAYWDAWIAGQSGPGEIKGIHWGV